MHEKSLAFENPGYISRYARVIRNTARKEAITSGACQVSARDTSEPTLLDAEFQHYVEIWDSEGGKSPL